MVYVDTGSYMLNGPMLIDVQDGGTPAGVVTICGSTHADGTTLDLHGLGGNVIQSAASYVTLEHLNLTGATDGAGFAPSDGSNDGYGAHTTIRNSRLYGNKYGVHLYWGPDDTTIQHNVIDGNTTAGVYSYSLGTSAENTQIVNNTIIAESADGLRLEDRISNTTVQNNIIQVSGSGRYGVWGGSTLYRRLQRHLRDWRGVRGELVWDTSDNIGGLASGQRPGRPQLECGSAVC